MSATFKQWSVICVGLTGVMTIVAWAGNGREVEEHVTLDQVPAAVKAVILAESAGAQITEIERETRNGQIVYEAEFVANGHEVEIKIAPDGTVLGREIETAHEAEDENDDDDLTIDQVPEPARLALLRLSRGATITEVERETEHGAEIYEAEWARNGVTHEAEVTADGALVELEETIALDKAPHVVRAAIAKHFGNTHKVTVAKKTIIVYEVETIVDGQEKELYVMPTGQVHGEHGNDAHDHDARDHDAHNHDGHNHDGHDHDGHDHDGHDHGD